MAKFVALIAARRGVPLRLNGVTFNVSKDGVLDTSQHPDGDAALDKLRGLSSEWKEIPPGTEFKPASHKPGGNAEDFVLSLAGDLALRERFEGLRSPEAKRALAESMGYRFSDKELAAAVKKHAPAAPPAPKAEDPMPATDKHLLFLRFRGYRLESLVEAQRFMDDLAKRGDLSFFLKDCDAWTPPPPAPPVQPTGEAGGGGTDPEADGEEDDGEDGFGGDGDEDPAAPPGADTAPAESKGTKGGRKKAKRTPARK